MAPTIQLYNHTRRLFASGANIPGDTYKLILCSAATFDATHTTLGAITYTEIVGNGYPAGGVVVTGVAYTTFGTSSARLDANDATVIPSGGDILANDAILVNDTNAGDPPLVFIDFGGTVLATVASGDPFEVRWDANGIVIWE